MRFHRYGDVSRNALEGSRTGYIVPPKDPQAIADAVVKCLEGDNLKRMSGIARSLAAEKYGWQTIAAQTAQVYHQFDETPKMLSGEI